MPFHELCKRNRLALRGGEIHRQTLKIVIVSRIPGELGELRSAEKDRVRGDQ